MVGIEDSMVGIEHTLIFKGSNMPYNIALQRQPGCANVMQGIKRKDVSRILVKLGARAIEMYVSYQGKDIASATGIFVFNKGRGFALYFPPKFSYARIEIVV